MKKTIAVFIILAFVWSNFTNAQTIVANKTMIFEMEHVDAEPVFKFEKDEFTWFDFDEDFRTVTQSNSEYSVCLYITQTKKTPGRLEVDAIDLSGGKVYFIFDRNDSTVLSVSESEEEFDVFVFEIITLLD